MLPPMVSRMLLRFPVRPKRRAIEIKNVAEISSVRPVRPVAQTNSVHNLELHNLELRGDRLRAKGSRVAANVLIKRTLAHGIKTPEAPG